jgi:hypothetical protein
MSTSYPDESERDERDLLNDPASQPHWDGEGEARSMWFHVASSGVCTEDNHEEG